MDPRPFLIPPPVLLETVNRLSRDVGHRLMHMGVDLDHFANAGQETICYFGGGKSAATVKRHIAFANFHFTC